MLAGGTWCARPQGLVPERGSSGPDRGTHVSTPPAGPLNLFLFQGRGWLSLAPPAALPPQLQFPLCLARDGSPP